MHSEVFLLPSSTTLTASRKKELLCVLNANFLEHFDFFLLIHLSCFLIPLFTAPDDPNKRALQAFAFVLSFIVRPFATLLWSFLGDRLGRVFVLFWTTLLMSVSCVLVPNIQPFAKIGSLATGLFFFARFLQGVSSGGEKQAASIFLTETYRNHKSLYFMHVLFALTCGMAGVFALLLISFTTSSWFPENGWKLCFYFGAAIAGFSVFFRKSLQDADEFTEARAVNMPENNVHHRFFKRNFMCWLGMNVYQPIAFVFMYETGFSFLSGLGMSPSQISMHNVWLHLVWAVFLLGTGSLTFWVCPRKIVRVRNVVGLAALFPAFLLLNSGLSFSTILMAQLLVHVSAQGMEPAMPLYIRGFYPTARFKGTAISWATSKAVSYAVSAYLSVHILEKHGMVHFFLWMAFGLVLMMVSDYYFVDEEKMRRLFFEKMDANLSVQSVR